MSTNTELLNANMYLSMHSASLDYDIDFINHSLAFTIHTKYNVTNPQFPRDVYVRLHSSLLGRRYKVGKETFSMFLCKDVEASRNGIPDRGTLYKPFTPHYHGLLSFPYSLWEEVNEDLHLKLSEAKQSLYELEEIGYPTDPSMDRHVFIRKFDPNQYEGEETYSPYLRYVQYGMKAYLASNYSMENYAPSVFPYDWNKKTRNLYEERYKEIFGDIQARQGRFLHLLKELDGQREPEPLMN